MSSRIVAENIKLKRAYDSAGSGDGTRILIDRLWPRGVRKADAAIDVWAKDIAPSTALRRWFGRSCSLARVSTPLLGRDTSASRPTRRTAYARSERADYTRFCNT
jgi:hypothetical protein